MSWVYYIFTEGKNDKASVERALGEDRQNGYLNPCHSVGSEFQDKCWRFQTDLSLVNPLPKDRFSCTCPGMAGFTRIEVGYSAYDFMAKHEY